MIGRIGRLTAAEFLKIFSQPFRYITLVAVLTGIVGAEFLQPIFRGQRETAWKTFKTRDADLLLR